MTSLQKKAKVRRSACRLSKIILKAEPREGTNEQKQTELQIELRNTVANMVRRG